MCVLKERRKELCVCVAHIQSCSACCHFALLGSYFMAVFLPANHVAKSVIYQFSILAS